MNHFVIITGFLNKEIKENYLIELVKKIKKNIKHITLCYTTHHDNIPKIIYELFDYVVYNKKNPILNWDICDNFTKTFGCQLDMDDDKSLLFFQPYHGYAHHLSICDGISIGVNTGHTTFSVMNYDCIDFCVEELNYHMEIIKKTNKCVFYNYGVDTDDLNTEFFTFNMDLATILHDMRYYDKFSSHKFMHYEKIVTTVVNDNNVEFELRKFITNNKALGKISYADDTVDGEILNDKLFAPFYEKWVDGKRYCFYFFPFKHNGKKHIVFIDESDGKMNCIAKINGDTVNYPNKSVLTLPFDDFYLEIFDNDIRVVNLFINDPRQYGIIVDNIKDDT